MAGLKRFETTSFGKLLRKEMLRILGDSARMTVFHWTKSAIWTAKMEEVVKSLLWPSIITTLFLKSVFVPQDMVDYPVKLPHLYVYHI